MKHFFHRQAAKFPEENLKSSLLFLGALGGEQMIHPGFCLGQALISPL
jgi:hypothetical protein